MAKNANYRVQLRRRRSGKTDYQARKAMVISGRHRLVVRPSLKNVTAQIIIAKPIGDMTIASANSRELIKKYGWKAPAGNIPAAYLTGLLCGLKAKAANVNNAILDLGMVIPTKGNKVFAALHGVVDAGVEIPYSDDKLVKERTKGHHIANYAEELGAESDEYKAQFSKFLKQKISPETLPEHFSKVRAAIVASFKDIEVAPEVEVKVKPKAKAPPPVKAAPPKEKTKSISEKVAPAKATAPVAPVKENVPEAKETVSRAKSAEAPAKATPPKPEKAAKSVKVESPIAEAKEKTPAKEKAVPVKENVPAEKATKKGENEE